MKKLIPLFAISAVAVACAGTGAVAPSTEMPSTTNTTAAPTDTNLPNDNKPIPALDNSATSPTTPPPAAAMKNTTSQSAGDAPTPTTQPAAMP